MDLKITITDENAETIEQFQIYQDGSDSGGAAQIRRAVEGYAPNGITVFRIEEEPPDNNYRDIELGEFTNREIHDLTGLIDEKLADLDIQVQSYAFSIMVTYTPTGDSL